MSKHLKKFKILLMSEEKTQVDICNYLKAGGFRNHSIGYVSHRMTGKDYWNIEEIYAFADWLSIPDEEILSYFPRRKVVEKKRLRVV